MPGIDSDSGEAVIDFAPSNKSVIEGGSLFWHCHADAHPNNITYLWYFGSTLVQHTVIGLRSEIRVP